jgi:hypothetical protein
LTGFPRSLFIKPEVRTNRVLEQAHSSISRLYSGNSFLYPGNSRLYLGTAFLHPGNSPYTRVPRSSAGGESDGFQPGAARAYGIYSTGRRRWPIISLQMTRYLATGSSS